MSRLGWTLPALAAVALLGACVVAVHDNTRAYQPWEKPYFVLAPGDVYDMKARRIVAPVQ